MGGKGQDSSPADISQGGRRTHKGLAPPQFGTRRGKGGTTAEGSESRICIRNLSGRNEVGVWRKVSSTTAAGSNVLTPLRTATKACSPQNESAHDVITSENTRLACRRVVMFYWGVNSGYKIIFRF